MTPPPIRLRITWSPGHDAFTLWSLPSGPMSGHGGLYVARFPLGRLPIPGSGAGTGRCRCGLCRALDYARLEYPDRPIHTEPSVHGFFRQHA